MAEEAYKFMFLGKPSQNFRQRAIMGTLFALITLVAIFFSHTSPFQYLFLALIATIQAVALWEYYKLAEKRNALPLKRLGITFATLFVITKFFALTGAINPIAPYVTLYLFAISAFVFHFSRMNGAIQNLATTLFGFCYISWPLSLLLDLNYGIVKSPIWLVFILFTTKMCDTCAYIIGKQFGSHKVAPILSPKKTLEGAIGGIIGSIIAAAAVIEIAKVSHVKVVPLPGGFEILLWGALIGGAAVAGDLAESLLKRDAKTKDSNELPGFGGVLDMADSMLFTAPLLYLLLQLT